MQSISNFIMVIVSLILLVSCSFQLYMMIESRIREKKTKKELDKLFEEMRNDLDELHKKTLGKLKKESEEKVDGE